MGKQTALVTGGCGFVGRHFVNWLLKHDYLVTAVDNLSTGIHPEMWPSHLRVNEESKNRFKFIHGDLRDYTKEASADFDLIIHLAAVVGGRLTIEGDPLSVATDLAIDATLFNWVVRERPMPRKLVYFSSSAAYPIKFQTHFNHCPLSEDMISFEKDIGIPDMTYGWSKLTGEFLARHAVEKYGLDVAIFRPFSGYGEDQDYTYPFPSIIRRVANGESPIVVWGSGNQLRDFIHIDDVVDAVFACLYAMEPGRALNLGSGEASSFRKLAESACMILGHAADVINDRSKPEGVFARVADCRKLFQFYQPRTQLVEGIQRAFQYQQKVRSLENAFACKE
ncbi:MAG TPA: NAD(P)-dependent oxidoreductase [Terriglobia bacterium]|nr:NAD(P)-dependent oxidoreductase [Terriglobia bacterium]